MSDYIPDHRAEDDEFDELEDQGTPLNVWMSNRTYDALKWLAQIGLPALGVFWGTIAGIYELGYGKKVLLTIVAVDVLLGALLQVSTKKYNAATLGALVGFMNVAIGDEGQKQVSLEFPGDPHDIDKHDKVTFKVRKQ